MKYNEQVGKLYIVSNPYYTADRGKYRFNLEEIVMYLKKTVDCKSYEHHEDLIFNYHFLVANGKIVVSYNCRPGHVESFLEPI